MVSETFFHDLYEKILRTPSQDVFLFFVGKHMSKSLKSGKTFDAKRIENFFRSMSLGSLSVEKQDLKQREFLFKLKNSAFKTTMKKPSCFVACGIIAGYVEGIYGQYAGAKEKKCVSKGDDYCEIEARVFNGHNF